MQTTTAQKLAYINEVEQNYEREMASLQWSDDLGQMILDVHTLAARLYNTEYYSEFYGDIVEPIGKDIEFCVIHNRDHFNAVVTIAMTMYHFKFPEQFNYLCRQIGADNVAIWFTETR